MGAWCSLELACQGNLNEHPHLYFFMEKKCKIISYSSSNSQLLLSRGKGRFQSIKTGVLLIFSFVTGDQTEFLSPMIISNKYIAGI